MNKFCSLFICVLPLLAMAQKNCGNYEYVKKQIAEHPEYLKNLDLIEKKISSLAGSEQKSAVQATVTLPVVFHVVYNTSQQNISDAKIHEQLKVLNEDFRKLNSGASLVPQVWQGIAADCEINFCLARRDPQNVSTTGIERRQTSVTMFGQDDNVKRFSDGGLDPWNTKHYINIWVCNMASGLYGYTPFPGGSAQTDGLVLNYRVVGKNGLLAGADSGHTATHEMGHYFYLRHIWGDDQACDSTDFVSDTPNQTGSTLGCATFPKTDACSPASPGVMFMNFMDYSDDICLNMFTQGQKTRMWALLDPQSGWRKELLTSEGCNPIIGVEEYSASKRVKLFSTSEAGVYRVENLLPAEEIQCFNLIGEALKFNFDTEKKLLNLTELPKGIYLLKVVTQNGNVALVKKFLK